MSFFTMIITLPLLYLAYDKRHEKETLYIIKLILIWFICQLYITVNFVFRIPIGLLAAFLFVWNEQGNKNSKFLGLLVGFVTFLSSSVVYLLYKL